MRTLDNKKTIYKNGQTIIDFAVPTYVPDFKRENFSISNVISLTDDYDRRPDLLCYTLWNSVDKLDMLLKWNGISDPLSVRSGDILIIPEQNFAEQLYIIPKQEQDRTKYADKYIDISKVSKKDQQRLVYLQKVSAGTKNGSSENIKTNQLATGISNINIDTQTNTLIL